MGLALASLLGQGDIPPPLWTAAPRRHPHHLQMHADLETTHPVEDSHLRMATLMATPYDSGRASANASGYFNELPSLWWGPRRLFPPLLPMFAGSRGMAGGRGGPSLHDIRGDMLELPVGGLLQARGRVEAEFRHVVGNLDP